MKSIACPSNDFCAFVAADETYFTMIFQKYEKKVGTKQSGVNYAFQDRVQTGVDAACGRIKSYTAIRAAKTMCANIKARFHMNRAFQFWGDVNA